MKTFFALSNLLTGLLMAALVALAASVAAFVAAQHVENHIDSTISQTVLSQINASRGQSQQFQTLAQQVTEICHSLAAHNSEIHC